MPVAAAAALLLGGQAQASAASAASASAKAAKAEAAHIANNALIATIQSRLQEPHTAKTFRDYNATHSQTIQDALAIIYGQDKDFLAVREGKDKPPLNDHIVGPITLSWVARFCRDLDIVAAGPDFAEKVVLALEHVAAIAKVHPDWSAILKSREFDAWISGQAEARQRDIYQIRRSGAAAQVNALIEEFLVRGAPAAKGAAAVAGLRVSYRLDPAAVTLQSDKQLMLARLQKKVLGAYPSERAFNDAVIGALDGSPLDQEMLTAIRSRARMVSYHLAVDGRELLRGDGMSDALLKQLVQLETQEPIAELAAFEGAVKKAVPGADLAADLTRWLPKIVDAATLTNFQLNRAALAGLANAKVPAAVMEMLRDLVGIEYPTRPLLESAIRWKLRIGVGLCRGNLSEHNRNPIEDGKFAELKPLLQEGGALALYTAIVALRPQATPCDDAQLKNAKGLDEEFSEFVLTLLRKTGFAKDNPKPQPSALTDWSVNSCSCLRNTLAGQVYGFYPYWLKGRERSINFGHLSRIGFYGLSFDESGDLTESPGARDWPLDLLQAAQKYNTKVDWVIHKNDWREWSTRSPGQKSARLDRLIDSIAAVLSEPMGDLRSRATPLLSLNYAVRPTHGDGVTIFFDGLPDADADLFHAFIHNLAARLDTFKGERTLNIMTTHKAMNKGDAGVFSYKRMNKLIEEVNKVDERTSIDEQTRKQALDMHLLVLIEEPTTDSKKVLRQEIEDSLRGLQRMRLLRDVIPVVVYDNVSSQQLDDDIIYFKDNFAGVGFWPLPLAASDTPADGGRSVDALLKLRYQVADTSSAKEQVCQVVCPNRVAFRGAFWLLLLAAVGITAYIFLMCCVCRAALAESYWVSGGLALLWVLWILLGLVMLVCDPLLKTVAEGNVPLFAVLALGIGGSVVLYIYKRSQRDKP